MARGRFFFLLFVIVVALHGIQRASVPWTNLLDDFTLPDLAFPFNEGSFPDAQLLFRKEYDKIDSLSDEERCARYGFTYNKNQKKRRIFFGSMIADDDYELVRMHAVETYGLYDFVNLVESNSTHCGKYNRTLRFAEGTEGHELIHSDIFGPDTTVNLDLYLEDAFGTIDMVRETIQREEILKGWKRAGMREDDLGLMSDMDEMFTRDFLHAAKVCDIEQFRPGQSCQSPSVAGMGLVFESSPECVAEDPWFHPNLILGECVVGIGDPTDRPIPKRKFRDVHGEREEGWGAKGPLDYPESVLKSGKFPLSNGADFRLGANNIGHVASWRVEGTPPGPFYRTGYHFHNFFASRKELRHKYTTYAHPYGGARNLHLSLVHPDDLDMMVRCARDLPNSADPTRKKRIEDGFSSYIGSKPIFFLNETYRRVRHALLQRIVEDDEKEFGSKYPPNTTHIIRFTTPAASDSTEKVEQLVTEKKSEERETTSIKAIEQRESTPFVVQRMFQEEYDKIDSLSGEERCARYGFTYNKNQKKRRIFFGSMIADDNYELVRMHAVETYGLYDFVNLVESNSTHCGKYNRTLRFAEGTEGHELIHSDIFGPDTTVNLDLYLEDAFGTIDMVRETIQREEILKGWKRAGMREDDLGLMSDMDEMFTRDFLHAAKVCDIEQFRPGQSCQSPSVAGMGLVFESSPECVAEDPWFHPNLILGECVVGIGDPTDRPIPKRKFRDVHGEREVGWGAKGPLDYPESVLKSGKFPLSNGADFRLGANNIGHVASWRVEGTPPGPFYRTGYHFHNFFASRKELRHKYTTYAHPYGGARDLHLSLVHPDDLDMMVRCARDLPNSADPTRKKRIEDGFSSYIGSKPIFFLNETYRRVRHALLQRIVEDDEKEFGSKYPPNTTHIIRFTTPAASDSTEKVEQLVTEKKSEERETTSIKAIEQRESTPFVVQRMFQEEYDKIDSLSGEERCARYGFTYNKNQKKRRIFFGSMIADDNYELVRMHAVETYGLYDFVNLVESNSTHCGKYNRTLRFAEGTEGHELIHSDIFGPDTTVNLDLYLEDAFGTIDMVRETIQREEILKGWKRAGMREDDLGLMSDMDEMFTRDFLHAAKVCDIEQFRPGQSCQSPSVAGMGLVFESSPECVAEDPWFHPNLILGECVVGIGDPTDRPIPKRKFRDVHGEREVGWGAKGPLDYPESVLKSGKFPLSNGADFRLGANNIGHVASWRVEGTPPGPFYRTGYHFHNFFASRKELRHKYTTYAHPYGGARDLHLSLVHPDDLDMMVRCARDLPNSADPTRKKRIEDGFSSYIGSKPIFFLNETYRRVRHALLQRIVEDDEKEFGSKYPPNTTHIIRFTTPAASDSTEKVEQLVTEKKSEERETTSIKAIEQRESTPFVVQRMFQEEYDKIDSLSGEERCARYGFTYNKNQKKRRIFFGSMIADDNYELVRMHAVETYGLYDFVNLVESNSTHCGKYNRTLRFAEGTEGHELIHSDIFGPDTTVNLDLYLEDAFGTIDMVRETIQREEILKGWKRAGMREDDLGLMSDMDEMFTRDFLHAAKVCDIEQFRPGQSCQSPSVAGMGLVFESSPECVAEDPWFHPNLILGECVVGIGDPTDRPIPKRKFRDVHGEREVGWGAKGPLDYPESVLKSGKFPLSNGADFRLGANNIGLFTKWRVEGTPPGPFYRTGYHFHNFFASRKELRHKYTTYAHPYGGARYMHLSLVHPDDLDMMVRCARDLPNSADPTRKKRIEDGFSSYIGSKPIFFLNETYRRVRHALLQRIVEDDEREFGSKYPPNATRMSPL